jgi:hypothetical protein
MASPQELLQAEEHQESTLLSLPQAEVQQELSPQAEPQQGFPPRDEAQPECPQTNVQQHSMFEQQPQPREWSPSQKMIGMVKQFAKDGEMIYQAWSSDGINIQDYEEPLTPGTPGTSDAMPAPEASQAAELELNTDAASLDAALSSGSNSTLEQTGSTLQTDGTDAQREVSLEVPVDKPGLGQVYYMQVKNGVLEIIGNIDKKLVFVKARLSEVAHAVQSKSFERIEEAQCILKARTMRIQDGYIYVTAKINDQVVCIKGKTSEIFDFAKAKAIQGLHFAEECAAPVTRRAGAVKDVVTAKAASVKEATVSKSLRVYKYSEEKATAVVQPFKPYYLKVHNGVAHIVGKVGDLVVVVQAKTLDISTSIQVRVAASVVAGRTAVDRFTSPIVGRALSFHSSAKNRIQYFTVSIKNGVLRLSGAVDERTVRVRTKVSELAGAVYAKTSQGVSSTREAIADLTANLVALLSAGNEKVCSTMKLLCTKSKDGYLYVACQVNARTVVMRVKVCDVVEYLKEVSMQFYSRSSSAMADGCSLAKTKTLELGSKIRSIAGKQQVQVTAGSAMGGAVALGASGGAAGLLAGGGMGAGCGVVFAPFTFGLSIPVGATIGATSGLFLGTAAGGTAGAVAGGAAGYGVHKHKNGISKGMNGAVSKAKAYKSLAADSTSKLCAKVVCSTGGSAGA